MVAAAVGISAAAAVAGSSNEPQSMFRAAGGLARGAGRASFGVLSMSDIDPLVLLGRAERSAHNAYAPYSGFRVGAAVLTTSGAVVTGCNVENASYPVGGCAERHAIAAAVAGEGPMMRIAAIAVVALDLVGDFVACAPCGACRQAIIEFGPDAKVLFRTDAGVVTPVKAADLLPGAFAFDPTLA